MRKKNRTPVMRVATSGGLGQCLQYTTAGLFRRIDLITVISLHELVLYLIG